MARERFSVATFNVKNLVNAETNYYQKKDGTWSRYSKENFEKKVNWLALQLAQMDADHVCLQEVFHAEALHEVTKRHAEIIAENGLTQSAYTEVIHFANDRSKPDDPSPGLAYLGRQPVNAHRNIQDLTGNPIELGDEFGLRYSLTSTSRPIAFLNIDLGSKRTGTLVITHLKSKRAMLEEGSDADEPGNFLFLDRAKGAVGSLVLRAGEALALRRELLALMKDNSEPVFVLGDLNDEVGAVTTEIVRGEAPWRNENDMNIKRGFWDVELHSAARTHLRRSEKADFTTHVYNGHHSTIDHIFFSQEFYYRNSSKSRIGDLDYVRAFNDHVIDKDMPGAPKERDSSDHGQLVAYFSYEEPDTT